MGERRWNYTSLINVKCNLCPNLELWLSLEYCYPFQEPEFIKHLFQLQVSTSARIRSFKMQQHHFYYIMTSWPLQYMSNLLIKIFYVHGFLFYIKICKCLYRVSRLMVTSVFKFALGLNVLMASLNIVVTRYSMQILRKPITVHCKCFIYHNN